MNTTMSKKKLNPGQFIGDQRFMPVSFLPGRIASFTIYEDWQDTKIKLVRLIGMVTVANMRTALYAAKHWRNVFLCQCLDPLSSGEFNDSPFESRHYPSGDRLDSFLVNGELCFKVHGFVSIEVLGDMIRFAEDRCNNQLN